MPYSRHKSVIRSPRLSRVMNSIFRSTGRFAFQGTDALLHPHLAGVTDVPGLICYPCTRFAPSGAGSCQARRLSLRLQTELSFLAAPALGGDCRCLALLRLPPFA